jgi:hypothetical protein
MSKFNILTHLDKLTHQKGDKYLCPVCGGNNLSIPENADTVGYRCFNGCETKAIREAIAPWIDRQPKTTQTQQKRQRVYTDLNGKPLIRVNRTDDGQGNKKIYQEYQADGVWTTKAPSDLKAKAKAAVMPYRYSEVMAAAATGQTAYWVEGEQCADALWALGLPATTSIGGSDGYKRYGDYSKVFAGVDLVIVPDRDTSGIKYADAIAQDYPQAQWLYAFPGSAEWDNLPKSGGLDVADWIASGADRVAIEAAVESRRSSPPATTDKPGNNIVPFPGTDQPEPIDKSEVDAAIELSQTVADIPALLPSLYPVLQTKAKRFNVPVETLVGILLSIGGSLLASSIQLKLEEGYYIPSILWVGLVGDSGATKTPILQAITKALQALQSGLYRQYESDRKFYDKQLKEWSKQRQGDEPEEPEKLRHYYTSDFTIESVIQIVAGQPNNGLAVIVDELAGFVNSFGEYKSGGGSDRQKWLSSYSGLPVKSDRKSSGTLMADRANISVAGTIQPSVLRKLMGDTEQVDGLWPRFLWFGVPTTVMPAPGEVAAIDITDILEGVYIRLSSYSGDTCLLSAEAQTLWIDWHRSAEKRKMAATSQAEQAIYPKAREQAARVALIAHHLEAAAQGIAPSAEISADTLAAAISLVKYCINQSLLIYGALGATAANPEAIRIAKFIERFAGQQVQWKQVRPILPKTRVGKTRRAANKTECVDFLRRVVELGYGVDHGDDCSSIGVNETPTETEFSYEFTAAEVA